MFGSYPLTIGQLGKAGLLNTRQSVRHLDGAVDYTKLLRCSGTRVQLPLRFFPYFTTAANKCRRERTKFLDLACKLRQRTRSNYSPRIPVTFHVITNIRHGRIHDPTERRHDFRRSIHRLQPLLMDQQIVFIDAISRAVIAAMLHMPFKPGQLSLSASTARRNQCQAG